MQAIVVAAVAVARVIIIYSPHRFAPVDTLIQIDN